MMNQTIKVNEKRSIKFSQKRNNPIVAVEHIFKGSAKWHILLDSNKMDVEKAIAEITTAGDFKQFVKDNDIMVFQGPA